MRWKGENEQKTRQWSLFPVLSCCMEGEISWSLVQSFCSCHNLPPSTAFIIECAKKAKWPPLLCHAQLYQIPTQEVLLSKFKLLFSCSSHHFIVSFRFFMLLTSTILMRSQRSIFIWLYPQWTVLPCLLSRPLKRRTIRECVPRRNVSVKPL